MHEWGHAFVADKLGDPTPRNAGRVTLNPLGHIDLWGTILFPLICVFMSSGILFGWGKPIPMNVKNFKRPVFYGILATGAGVLGNFLLCLVASFILAFGPNYYLLGYTLLGVNACLIVFNMLPLPGLDGFYAVKYLFRFSDATVDFLERWGFFILIILINVPLFRAILRAVVHQIMSVFITLSVGLYEWLVV